jgi:hypothetical protein
MSKRIDLCGMSFGWLFVLSRAESASGRQGRFVCRCRCGREVVVLGYALTSCIKRSCGECEDKKTRVTISEIGQRGSIIHFGK